MASRLGGVWRMTIRKFNPGCPCCGCEYHFDDFNRSSSTDVGGDYTETSGDWSIVDFGGGEGSLLIQNSNAVLTIDKGALNDGVAGFVHFAFHAGDEVRFLLNYTDSDNYHFVQLEIGTGGISSFTAELSIWERSSGTNNLLMMRKTIAPAQKFGVLYVYWGTHPDGYTYIAAYSPSSNINGYSSDECYVEVRGITFTSNDKALATGALTSAVYFDSLYLWNHYSEANPACPSIKYNYEFTRRFCEAFEFQAANIISVPVGSCYSVGAFNFTLDYSVANNDVWIHDTGAIGGCPARRDQINCLGGGIARYAGNDLTISNGLFTGTYNIPTDLGNVVIEFNP